MRLHDGHLPHSPGIDKLYKSYELKCNSKQRSFTFIDQDQKTKKMETIKLTIPNMKSPHCQMTVSNTIQNLGASVKSVAPTQAEIELNNGITAQAVISAIEKAGYPVKK